MRHKSSQLPPEVPRIQSFLDSLRMSQNPIAVFSKYTQQMGDTYLFHFGGIKKAMVTSRPEILQHILKKNYANYHKSDIQVNLMGHFLGSGLLTSHGEYWLTQRRLIQEGFRKDRLSSILQIMNDVMTESLDEIDQTAEGQSIEITSLLTELTFKMVMRTLYSNSLSPEELKSIGHTISTIQQFIIRQIVQPYLNPWFKFSGLMRKYEIMREESDKIIMEKIQARRHGKGQHEDMLQTLLDARYKESGKGMSDKQILMESMQLIVAGHETSSNALFWVLYLLLRNSDSFRKVKEEIQSTFSDQVIDMARFSQLTYTVQVIEEALRLYPPFWMIDRVAMEDDEVSGFHIPKGTMVLVFTYGLHHSTQYWEKPEEFHPERFEKEAAKNRAPFTHIPFGGGPRVCIGGNYAILQMLLIMVRILSRYEISFANNSQVEIGPLIILRPKGKLNIHFKPKA